MDSLLKLAGKAFLKAFASSLIILSLGIWKAPDLHGALLVSVSAVFASVAAGISALQAYVPALTVAQYVPAPWGPWIDSFLRAFAASLVLTLPGALTAPDLATGRALAVAAVVGALNAGLHVLQGFLTPGQVPVPTSGLRPRLATARPA